MMSTHRILPLALLLCASCARPAEPGDPLAGLGPAEREQFERGRVLFDSLFAPASGLGPLFNAPGCVACHSDPASGGAGALTEVHATALGADGTCNLLAELGGPVYQALVTPALRDALGIETEPIPTEATHRATRSAPDVFGFGLLDAVPESTILAMADPDDSNGDGISGRVNRFFDGRLGRFGRKAFLPSLAEFNEGAFQIEQGITTPNVPAEGTAGGRVFPPGVDTIPDPELNSETVALVDAFVRFLAAPERRSRTRDMDRGEELFGTLGCASCHVPTLRTGQHPVRALANRPVHAYTDLLLHDMGPDAADVCFGLASRSEFRTEPLMGLRLMRRFMHDGKATSVEEAIRLHGGEALAARERFAGLDEADRQALLSFLASL
jgi:CxxC motif-containing protein (DUF1111 family)